MQSHLSRRSSQGRTRAEGHLMTALRDLCHCRKDSHPQRSRDCGWGIRYSNQHKFHSRIEDIMQIHCFCRFSLDLGKNSLFCSIFTTTTGDNLLTIFDFFVQLFVKTSQNLHIVLFPSLSKCAILCLASKDAKPQIPPRTNSTCSPFLLSSQMIEYARRRRKLWKKHSCSAP